MAKLTRLATTVTSHEIKNDSLINIFYLDGRSNRFPQTNDLDITLDRTALGFYLNISSTRKKDANRDNLLEKRVSQDQITEAIKTSADIDSVVNDMAENAIKLTGKFNLDTQKRESRPYYSGVIIKESELAAVTLGEAVAFLYRDEALYPLTENDFNFKAENFHGQAVDNYDIYAAGRAGSIKYSNIAQLRVDDCIILVTNNVVKSLGQKNLLKILDEAYDQQESAELIHEYMTLKHPNEPFQFMMSFVEDIFVTNKKYRGDGFVSRDTQSTQIFTDEYLAEIESAQAEAESDTAKYAATANGVATSAAVEATTSHQTEETNNSDTSEHESEYSTYNESSDNENADAYQDDENFSNVANESSQENYYENDYEQNDYEEDEYELEDDLEEEAEEPNRFQKAYAKIVENDDYDYDESGHDEEDIRYMSSRADSEDALDFDEEDEGNKGGRKVFLVTILLIVLALAILGLAYLLKEKGFFVGSDSAGTTSSSTSIDEENVTDESTTEEESETSTTTSSEEESTTTTSENDDNDTEVVNGSKKGKNGGSYPAEYEVQWGDNLDAIFENVYGESYDTNVDYETKLKVFNLIIENNPETITGSIEGEDLQLYAETTIKIPDPSEILEAK
ncbi:hypothetical protein [Fastidiosipila sanguinis]|uniref:Uncharacterized protein n=1 Tax=Fastidiosipila sanguinis TaxID=236753 RepID=A0A2S0KLT8_9FIRM|nr:hypothetical protein [Fastidiosipila sanguinis]AVM42002.1 hypothetical protein C5Q98_01580 [Fastidiosipila sanguinis]